MTKSKISTTSKTRAIGRGASNVQHAPIGIEYRLLHHLGERRMRENRVDALRFGGFKIHRHHVTLDQLGDLGADHMGAEQLPAGLVEDHLDQSLVLAERDRLAVADERKDTHPNG